MKTEIRELIEQRMRAGDCAMCGATLEVNHTHQVKHATLGIVEICKKHVNDDGTPKTVKARS